MAEHTKTPFITNCEGSHLVLTENYQIVADCSSQFSADECAANADFIVEACNNYASLREENAALAEALSEYVILGHGKCTIGERAFLMGSDALAKSREGNGGNNG